jgi:hypothetical protein
MGTDFRLNLWNALGGGSFAAGDSRPEFGHYFTTALSVLFISFTVFRRNHFFTVCWFKNYNLLLPSSEFLCSAHSGCLGP